MKRITRLLVFTLTLLTLAGLMTVPVGARQGGAARRTGASGSTVTLPRDTYVRLRLNDELSSKTARVGDRFTAEVVTPVYRGGLEVIPAGSTVSGRVSSVQRARGKSRSGYLGIHFTALTLPGRSARAIDGSPVEVVDKDSGQLDEEGRLKGASSKKRNIVFIGGGAAGGAILGSVIGGRKGGAIGLLAGGAAGAAAALLKKGHEAKISRGTEVGMVINRPVTLPRRA